MEKIPTAEEFLQNYKNDSDHYADQDYDERRLIKALKEFAQLHVEAALKEASATDIVSGRSYKHRTEYDKDSILKSYSLENIK